MPPHAIGLIPTILLLKGGEMGAGTLLGVLRREGVVQVRQDEVLPEEHVEVFIVVLEHESYMLSSLPSINIRCPKGGTISEPLTDAVRAQELVELSLALIAVPECSYFVDVGPIFAVKVQISVRVQTLELVQGIVVAAGLQHLLTDDLIRLGIIARQGASLSIFVFLLVGASLRLDWVILPLFLPFLEVFDGCVPELLPFALAE